MTEIAKDPKQAQVIDEFHAFYDEKEFEQAEALISSRLALYPNDPEYISRLGSIHLSKGNLAEAWSCIQTAWILDPTLDVAYRVAFAYFLAQEDLDHARECAQCAFQFNPESWRNQFNMLLIASRSQDIDLAASLPVDYLRHAPRDVDTHRLILTYEFSLRRWEHAIRREEILFDIEPNPEHLHFLIVTLVRVSRFKEAYELYSSYEQPEKILPPTREFIARMVIEEPESLPPTTALRNYFRSEPWLVFAAGLFPKFPYQGVADPDVHVIRQSLRDRILSAATWLILAGAGLLSIGFSNGAGSNIVPIAAGSAAVCIALALYIWRPEKLVPSRLEADSSSVKAFDRPSGD